MLQRPCCTSSASLHWPKDAAQSAHKYRPTALLGYRVNAHDFSHFQRIAQGRRQRLAHIADHGGRATACGIGRFGQRLCQARAVSISFIKAPLPVFTSSTKPSKPPANFLDKIEAVIKSMLSTVDVTSRTAYKTFVRRRDRALAPTIAQPALVTTSRNCARSVGCSAGDGFQFIQRPASVAQTTPRNHRDKAPHRPPKPGPRTELTQSPTPPVECLSKIGPSRSPRQHRAAVAHGDGQRHTPHIAQAVQAHSHRKRTRLGVTYS